MRKLAGFLFIGLMVLPAASSAQGAPSDPEAGSPAGTIYELPLDSARGDAAPKAPVRGAAGSPRRDGTRTVQSARPASPIRSENGFGSSTAVPGADAVDGGSNRGEAAGSAATGSGSGGSGGSGSDADEADAPAAGTARARGSGSGADARAATSARAEVGSSEPSSLLTYGLLALVLVAGVTGGIVTRMRHRPPR